MRIELGPTLSGIDLHLDAHLRRAVPNRVVAVAAALAVIGALAVFFAFRFVAEERARDLHAWQLRLGIIADSRTADVEDWLDRQHDAMRGLAQNASLQLYMTELALSGGKKSQVGDEPAQAAYLRNLLIASAERTGFLLGVKSSPGMPNVSRVGLAGIALIDPSGRVLVATPGMPPVEGRLRDFLNHRKPGERALLDMFLDASGAPAMGFLAPVFAVQGEHGPAGEIGVVFGVKELGQGLFRRLQQPGDTGQSSETLLVRRNGERIEYLSPLADGTHPLTRVLAADTPELAEAFAIATPGGFGERVDYAGRRVLVTGRALAAAPWTLVRKIDAPEALAETDYRGRALLGSLLGAILLAALVIVAVWRHGTSVRATEAAANYRHMADRHARLARFLRVVTDGQPTAISTVDAEGRFTFANREAAAELDVPAEDMIGKRMASMFGSTKAQAFEQLNRQALAEGRPVSATRDFIESNGERIVRSQHIPLVDGEAGPGSVLMIQEDVTDLTRERARRESAMKQLVATLVGVIDRRDPFAAHHSARVAEVARAIAEEMQLDARHVETAEIAASLMNLGKIAIPADVLTRAGGLKDDEIRMIRESVLASADLLEAVEFDGPVVETLRQLQEHCDGSGMPRGLKGDAILLTARIVAVANAFVGMVSARAYRSGMALDEAAALLLKEAGARFDRRPIAALMNILDNRDGRARWASFVVPPSAGRI